LIEKFRAIVGDNMGDEYVASPLCTRSALFHGHRLWSAALDAEVSAICKLAKRGPFALVPQGGNTGLVGGRPRFMRGRDLDAADGQIRDIDTASTP